MMNKPALARLSWKTRCGCKPGLGQGCDLVEHIVIVDLGNKDVAIKACNIGLGQGFSR